MSKSKWYREGYARGWNVASWQEMPAIGSRLPRDMDWQGIDEIETIEQQIDAFELICHEAESNDRCYSPFEFTASEINALGEWKSSEAWDKFDAGITAGARAYRRKHWSKRKLRAWNKPE